MTSNKLFRSPATDPAGAAKQKKNGQSSREESTNSKRTKFTNPKTNHSKRKYHQKGKETAQEGNCNDAIKGNNSKKEKLRNTSNKNWKED